jgi:hypothetical protein
MHIKLLKNAEKMKPILRRRRREKGIKSMVTTKPTEQKSHNSRLRRGWNSVTGILELHLHWNSQNSGHTLPPEVWDHQYLPEGYGGLGEMVTK